MWRLRNGSLWWSELREEFLSNKFVNLSKIYSTSYDVRCGDFKKGVFDEVSSVSCERSFKSQMFLGKKEDALTQLPTYHHKGIQKCYLGPWMPIVVSWRHIVSKKVKRWLPLDIQVWWMWWMRYCTVPQLANSESYHCCIFTMWLHLRFQDVSSHGKGIIGCKKFFAEHKNRKIPRYNNFSSCVMAKWCRGTVPHF